MMASLTRHFLSSARSTIAGSNDALSSWTPITPFTACKPEMMFSRTLHQQKKDVRIVKACVRPNPQQRGNRDRESSARMRRGVQREINSYIASGTCSPCATPEKQERTYVLGTDTPTAEHLRSAFTPSTSVPKAPHLRLRTHTCIYTTPVLKVNSFAHA